MKSSEAACTPPSANMRILYRWRHFRTFLAL